MLLKCTESFETREGGYPRTLEEGTVWYKSTYDYADGGYELVVLERVDGGAFTNDVVRVRLERLECFEAVPPSEGPIACSVFTNA